MVIPVRKIRQRIKLEDFYKIYLGVLNAFVPVPLTRTEIDVLSYLYLSGKVLTTEVRKIIREKLRVSEKNFNNFISKLVKKKALLDIEGRKIINKNFLPPESNDVTVIQLEFTFEKDESRTDQV